MPTPTRDTAAGRAYNDLRNLARRTGRGTDELLVSYALERFLFRLSQDVPQRFVLKGGMLLACFGARRSTKDIDLLAEDLANDHETIKHQVTAVATKEIDDGVVFDVNAIRVTTIREDADYAGVRAILPASVSRARLRLGIDVNFGDPVTPAAQLIDFPQLLVDQPFELLGYPIETVIAEKLCTAIVLASFNTRERDYADLFRLLTTRDIEGTLVEQALLTTAGVSFGAGAAIVRGGWRPPGEAPIRIPVLAGQARSGRRKLSGRLSRGGRRRGGVWRSAGGRRGEGTPLERRDTHVAR